MTLADRASASYPRFNWNREPPTGRLSLSLSFAHLHNPAVHSLGARARACNIEANARRCALRRRRCVASPSVATFHAPKARNSRATRSPRETRAIEFQFVSRATIAARKRHDFTIPPFVSFKGVLQQPRFTDARASERIARRCVSVSADLKILRSSFSFFFCHAIASISSKRNRALHTECVPTIFLFLRFLALSPTCTRRRAKQ